MIKNVKPPKMPNIIMYVVVSSSQLVGQVMSYDGVIKVELVVEAIFL